MKNPSNQVDEIAAGLLKSGEYAARFTLNGASFAAKTWGAVRDFVEVNILWFELGAGVFSFILAVLIAIMIRKSEKRKRKRYYE